MLKDYPVATVLPVTNLEASILFYTSKLGLSIKQKQEGMAIIEAGMGSVLVLYERPPVKAEHTQAGFSVANLEPVVAELKSKGVVFEEYDTPNLKTVDGIATVDGAKSSWFKDPDGNIIAISEMGV